MKKLHPVQKRLLEILKNNIDDPITIRDMQEILGISTPSLVHHHIKQLEKNGYLKRDPYNPQNYQIIADAPEKKITYLNLFGLAVCGPGGSILNETPIDRIPISSRILTFPASEAFLVKAKGDSMLPKISNGDLIIVKRTQICDNGNIAVCVNNGEGMIKKISNLKNQGNKKIILNSLNPKFDPIIASSDFRIEGEVKGIITNKVNI